MRVLIVEDDDTRMLIFDVVFEHDDVTRAYDAERGSWWLQRAEFDLVMLDHDLVGSYFCKETYLYKKSGQDVARTIAAMDNPPPVIVHSWNPIGARSIDTILARKGIPHMLAPFGSCTANDVRLFMEGR